MVLPLCKPVAPNNNIPSNSQASKEHEIIKDIEQRHYCEVCNATCIVLGKDNSHYVYSTTDKFICWWWGIYPITCLTVLLKNQGADVFFPAKFARRKIILQWPGNFTQRQTKQLVFFQFSVAKIPSTNQVIWSSIHFSMHCKEDSTLKIQGVPWGP